MKDVDPKLIAIISYLTFVGWIIAFILHHNNKLKYSLASFHLKQSLGLLITYMLVGFCTYFFHFLLFLGGFFSGIVYFLLFIMVVLGILNAVNDQEKTRSSCRNLLPRNFQKCDITPSNSSYYYFLSLGHQTIIGILFH